MNLTSFHIPAAVGLVALAVYYVSIADYPHAGSVALNILAILGLHLQAPPVTPPQ